MENNNKSSNHAFFSYCRNPNIKFETYEKGEEVILLLRAHPITLLGNVLNAIFLIIFLIIVNFVIYQFFNANQIFLINIFSIVFIISYLWYVFLNWYFNVGIITDKKVVDVDFSSILYKEITVAQLKKIEDITVKSGGYFESLFDYGIVFIQTAGTEANIEFINIAKPSDVASEINKLLSHKHEP